MRKENSSADYYEILQGHPREEQKIIERAYLA